MIEQIKAAFAESSATLQTLRIEQEKAGHILFAYMTYEPGHYFHSMHLSHLIGLANWVVVEAKILEEGNLLVTVLIDQKKLPGLIGDRVIEI